MANAKLSSRKILIAPSILSANFANLEAEIKKAEKAGADMIHVDVMDGHFVPNITFGPGLVKAVRNITKLPLGVHLMIEYPEKYIPQFAEAGANYLTVHYEACTHLNRIVHSIKELGVKAGVTLNPHNPVFLLQQIISDADLVLLMSVNPGFGGQKFIERTVDKIAEVRAMIDERDYECVIEVDGGINNITSKKCIAAGVDILVSGSYIFKDYKKAIDSLRP
jgi:ribulose-phosphate 3-epimerase